MPLTSDSFIQAAPEHVSVRGSDEVGSLTRGKRLLRKAGKLSGSRHRAFMMEQMTNGVNDRL